MEKTAEIKTLNAALKAARSEMHAARDKGDKAAAKAARARMEQAYRERDVLLGLRATVDAPRVKGKMGEHLAPEVLSALGRKVPGALKADGGMQVHTPATAPAPEPTIAKWDPKAKRLVPTADCPAELADKLGLTPATAIPVVGDDLVAGGEPIPAAPAGHMTLSQLVVSKLGSAAMSPKEVAARITAEEWGTTVTAKMAADVLTRLAKNPASSVIKEGKGLYTKGVK